MEFSSNGCISVEYTAAGDPGFGVIERGLTGVSGVLRRLRQPPATFLRHWLPLR